MSAPGRKRLERSPSRSKGQSPTATSRENKIEDQDRAPFSFFTLRRRLAALFIAARPTAPRAAALRALSFTPGLNLYRWRRRLVTARHVYPCTSVYCKVKQNTVEG